MDTFVAIWGARPDRLFPHLATRPIERRTKAHQGACPTRATPVVAITSISCGDDGMNNIR